MDIDIGSINISVQGQGQDKGKVENQSEDDIPITNWHHDSYPFVCVVMMSDASKMVGGETALRSGSGEIMKVRGPQMVSSFPATSTWVHSLLVLATNVPIALGLHNSHPPLGLCCHSSRSMHLAPSTCGHWRRRTHHHDHVFPSSRSHGSRYISAHEHPTPLRTLGVILPMDRVQG